MKIKDKRDDMNKNSMDKAKEQAGSALYQSRFRVCTESERYECPALV
jgi:hypothetical protein